MKLERAEDCSKAAWMAGERAGAMTREVAAGWTAAEMLGAGHCVQLTAAQKLV
jgi:hypothetical protein